MINRCKLCKVSLPVVVWEYCEKCAGVAKRVREKNYYLNNRAYILKRAKEYRKTKNSRMKTYK